MRNFTISVPGSPRHETKGTTLALHNACAGSVILCVCVCVCSEGEGGAARPRGISKPDLVAIGGLVSFWDESSCFASARRGKGGKGGHLRANSDDRSYLNVCLCCQPPRPYPLFHRCGMSSPAGDCRSPTPLPKCWIASCLTPNVVDGPA